jgi:EmrB/QacA subfamily drug resistance transporter
MTTDANRKWWALAAVGSGTFMSTIDGSIVNIALNTIQKTFTASLGQVEWAVLAYLLGIVCLLPSMGRLGDMIGRKRVYMAGFIIFTTASVLCGSAWSLESLVAFRVMQAIGAAMIQSMGIALLVQAFPSSERGRALGYNGTIIATGIATGPVLGGLIIGTLGWRAIFYVNFPIGIIAMLISLRALSADNKRSDQKFDLLGAVLLGGSLVSILYSLTEGQHVGFTVPYIMTMFAVGIVGLIGFVLWELRTPEPMVNMQFFRIPNFSLGIMTAMSVGMGIQFNFILLPFFMQNVLHFNAQKTGLMMVISPIAISIMSTVSGRLSDRFGPRWIAPIGMAILGFGLFNVSTLTPDSTVFDIIIRVVFIGFGFGTFQSPNTSSVMGSLPKERGGIANGILSVMRTIGQISGVTVAGAIWTSRVAAITGTAYTDITKAPVMALTQGFQTALIVAACIVWVGIIPALFRNNKMHEAPTAA